MTRKNPASTTPRKAPRRAPASAPRTTRKRRAREVSLPDPAPLIEACGDDPALADELRTLTEDPDPSWLLPLVIAAIFARHGRIEPVPERYRALLRDGRTPAESIAIAWCRGIDPAAWERVELELLVLSMQLELSVSDDPLTIGDRADVFPSCILMREHLECLLFLLAAIDSPVSIDDARGDCARIDEAADACPWPDGTRERLAGFVLLDRAHETDPDVWWTRNLRTTP